MNVTSKTALRQRREEPARRLGERQWIEAAVRHLAQANVDDIRVEELARELGVTKGSFYWHFRNREHLLERVLDHWMDRATIQITRWARATEAHGLEKLFQLLSLPARTSPEKRGADIELAVRSWARRDDKAAAMVRKVDQVRAEFFRELMAELGLSEEETQRRAAIAQAFMLGDALLKTGQSQATRLAAVRACAELLSSEGPARPQ